MRFLFIIDHLRPDGSQAVLIELVRELLSLNHVVAVCELNAQGPRDALILENMGVRVIRLTKIQLLSGMGLLRLFQEFLFRRPEVVFTILFYSDILGRIFAAAFGISTIISSIQAQNVHYSPLQRLLSRSTIRLASSVLVPSKSLVATAIAIDGARQEQVRVVPFSFPIFTGRELSRQDLRARLKVDERTFLVGTAGRLVPQKGHDILLRAFQSFRGSKAILLIAGTGTAEGRLRELIENLELSDCVRLVGHQREFHDFLTMIDLYVQPSRFEGVPISVMSAMAAGCPVIASAIPGLRDLIESNQNGVPVPPEDPVALTSAIRLCMEDDEFRKRIASEGSAYVHREFSAQAMVARILDCVEKR